MPPRRSRPFAFLTPPLFRPSSPSSPARAPTPRCSTDPPPPSSSPPSPSPSSSQPPQAPKLRKVSSVSHTPATSAPSGAAAGSAAPAWPAAPPVTAAGNVSGFGPSVTVEEMMQSLHGEADPLWELMRREAAHAAATEPPLASSLHAAVLVHSTLEDSLANVLANALDTETFRATQWVELFRDALRAEGGAFGAAVRTDLAAFMQRDPATSHAARVLLFAKGFQALQCWRLSSWLWRCGRRSLALYLQSMISCTFAVDIHPAARIGTGVLIDHGTGIVIGETATVGNNVSILHNVTLGGTGKEGGDRHPKIADGVMIGAGAAILGNIKVGTGAHIAACSVVLKEVEPFSIVSGVPGKVVGRVRYEAGVMPSFVMDQRLSIEVMGKANPYQTVVTGSVKGVDESGEDDMVDMGAAI